MPLSNEANQETLRRARSFGRWQRELETILPRRRGPGGARLVLGLAPRPGGGPILVYPPGGGIIVVPPLVPPGGGQGAEAGAGFVPGSLGGGPGFVPGSPGGGPGFVPGSPGGGSLVGPPIGVEVPPPVPGYPGGVWPGGPGGGGGLNIQNLEIYPVSLYGFTATVDVNGTEIGPIPGPALIRWVIFSTTVGFGSNDHDTQWRVDFSPVAGRDSFTFVASNPPTGVSSAPYTLFPYSADFLGGGAGSDGQFWGWASVRPQIDADRWYLNNLAVKIPLSSFFVKVYFANDTAATEGFHCQLGISPLSGTIENVEGMEVYGPPVMGL